MFFQHILIMHVNDSLQRLFVLTYSYADPKTQLIFHFLYLFLTDRPLRSTSLFLCFPPLLKNHRNSLLPQRKFHYITGVWFQLFSGLVLLVNGFSVWLFEKEIKSAVLLNTGLVCEF